MKYTVVVVTFVWCLTTSAAEKSSQPLPQVPHHGAHHQSLPNAHAGNSPAPMLPIAHANGAPTNTPQQESLERRLIALAQGKPFWSTGAVVSGLLYPFE